MLTQLYALKQNLAEQGIFLSFSGPVSQDLMVEMGATLKQKMKLEDASKSTVLKVFSMVVENAQNIIHYSAEKLPRNSLENEDELSLGIIAVGYKSDHYFVLCGNMIENKKKEKLRRKLTRIQSMNKNELKRFYKEQRKKPPDKDSKGGGLGFIDMARKSSQPIAFHFESIDEDYSFFSIKIVI